jgi:hypothetical protein
MRVQFLDFWPNFNTTNNVILDHIRKYREVEVVVSNPDMIVCSIFGRSSLALNKPKILIIGECIQLSHDALKQPGLILILTTTSLNHPKAYTYPWGNWYHPINHIWAPSTKPKTRFCAFVISNPRCEIRNNIFLAINSYKKVDSAGRALNNVGYQAPGAIDDSRGHGTNREFIDWLSQYKFYICCENRSHPGYHTEKIMNAYLANCVPIYWGADTIFSLHTAESMVYVRNMVDAVREIRELDTNAHVYKRKQEANPYKEPLESPNSPYNYERHSEIIRDVINNL